MSSESKSRPITPKQHKIKGRDRRRSSVHEHAKKVSNMIDGLGKGISNRISSVSKKTKKFAIERVVKVEPSKEPQEMVDALNQLKTIKTMIDSLSDKTITNLYNEQVNQSIYSLQLSETLMSLQSPQNDNNDNNEQEKEKEDLFKTFSNNVMGRKLFKLNTMTNEYLIKMEKELINPISIFKTKELKKSQQLLIEYESIKTDFDFANHKYQKLLNAKQKQDDKDIKKQEKKQEKNKEKNVTEKNKERKEKKEKRNNDRINAKKEKEANKISIAENKKNEKYKLLNEERDKVINCINSLECKRQINLLNCFDQFWKCYTIFSQQQDQIIGLKDQNDEKFQNQKKIAFGDTEQNITNNNDDKIIITNNNDGDDDDNEDNEDKTIFDEEEEAEENENMASFSDLMKSKSLRVAELNNDNQPLSKELRYKNPYKLGSGAFATVYRANDLLSDDKQVAIKKICIGDGDNVLYLSSTKDEAENELKIMKSLNGHKNIIFLIDDYYEKTVYNDLYLNLVMDYIPNTLLSQCEYYAESGDTIPHDLIQLYSYQLCKAVNYMHIKKIAHRDIKPDNLLINPKTNQLKLCDFGCSIKMKKRYNNDNDDDDEKSLEIKDDDLVEKDGDFQSYVCSRYYRAPELILQSGYYDCKVDIWSIGCVISEMFLGTLLFCGDNNENEHLDDIIKKLGTPTEEDIDDMNPDYIYKEDILDRDELGESYDMLFCAVTPTMPQNAINLISKTLIYSPKERISSLKCLTSSYFDSLKINEKYKQLTSNWNDLEINYAKINGIQL